MAHLELTDDRNFLVLILSLLFVLVNGTDEPQTFDSISSIRRTNIHSYNQSYGYERACIVQTNLGLIIGKELETVLGDPENVKFCGYRGIPYAKPPISELRFKPPVAYGSWEGVLLAYDYGSICYQFSSALTAILGIYNWPISENCLFLNVFTPSPQTCDYDTTNIPVLIYIHGGSFTEGHGNDFIYGANILLNKCVILVTLNYRLGTFGFLSLRTSEYSGNMGLKDQKLAIKWVKDNIAEFGGDPNRITVFGESAGGASTCYQTMNAESRKNFNQIYAMSSTPLNYYTQMKSFDHSDRMIKVARKTGKFILDKAKLIDFIKNVDANIIVKHTSHRGAYGFTFDTEWAPIVERAGDVEAFITKDPLEFYETENYDVPTILSELTLEYFTFLLLYLTNPLGLITKNNISLYLPIRKIDQEACANELRPVIDDIRKFYFGKTRIDFDSIRQIIRMTSDMNFAFHIQKTVALLGKRSSAPIRFQIHNQRTPLNVLTSLPILSTLDGTGHFEDVCYYFYCESKKFIYDDINRYRNTYQTYTEANLVSNVFVEFLVNYATNGKPSSETASFKSSAYPTVENDSYTQMPYVEITNTGAPVTGINPNWEAFNLWTQVEQKIDKIKKLSCNRKYH